MPEKWFVGSEWCTKWRPLQMERPTTEKTLRCTVPTLWSCEQEEHRAPSLLCRVEVSLSTEGGATEPDKIASSS